MYLLFTTLHNHHSTILLATKRAPTGQPAWQSDTVSQDLQARFQSSVPLDIGKISLMYGDWTPVPNLEQQGPVPTKSDCELP